MVGVRTIPSYPLEVRANFKAPPLRNRMSTIRLEQSGSKLTIKKSRFREGFLGVLTCSIPLVIIVMLLKMPEQNWHDLRIFSPLSEPWGDLFFYGWITLSAIVLMFGVFAGLKYIKQATFGDIVEFDKLRRCVLRNDSHMMTFAELKSICLKVDDESQSFQLSLEHQNGSTTEIAAGVNLIGYKDYADFKRAAQEIAQFANAEFKETVS